MYQELIVDIDKKYAAQLVPSLSQTDNKVRRGKSLIMAGSDEFPGAGILSARAAMRAGSGYVILAHAGLQSSENENPEFLFRDLNQYNWENLKCDAILVGPGFGINAFTASVIEKLKQLKFEKVILDADALTVCAREKLFPLPQSWIVTPHTGELARCLEVSSDEIDREREKFVQKAYDLFNCSVLLKGHHSLICAAQGIYRNLSGNSGLAKSGTGDVLAGIITAFRAQNMTASEALILGTYVHGACANLWWAQKKDPLSLVASDVIELIPKVLFRLRQLQQKSGL